MAKDCTTNTRTLSGYSLINALAVFEPTSINQQRLILRNVTDQCQQLHFIHIVKERFPAFPG